MLLETCERRKLAPLVVKIGGSLLSGQGQRLAGLVAIIARARRPLVIVPGGGVFADAVRRMQTTHDVSDRAAHAMALLAMHQMGLLLQDMHPRLIAVETLASVRQALAHNRIPVWLPLRLAETDESIPADWSVTSDALAARLAERLRIEGVLLVKSRRVPKGPTAEELAEQGIVDPRGQQVVEHLRVEEHVAVQDDEAVTQQVAREPQRVEAVRGGVPAVQHEVHLPRAGQAHLVRAVPGHDGDGGDAGRLQRLDLAVQQGAVADARQALRAIADHALQASAPARGKDDRPHSGSSAGRSRESPSICPSFSR